MRRARGPEDADGFGAAGMAGTLRLAGLPGNSGVAGVAAADGGFGAGLQR